MNGLRFRHVWPKQGLGQVQAKTELQCERGSTKTLSDAIEYRCCREVGPTLHHLTFDGSIEKITCITLHEEYKAISLS